MAARPLKVSLVCTGVGVMNRGIETFARDCFDGLHGTPGLDLTLLKGAGPDVPPDERRLTCLPRSGVAARLLGRAMQRNGYVVEQLSSLLPLIGHLRRERPDVVFTSEGNLRRWLFHLRPFLGVPFRLLFSNGGPVNPPFPDADHVQQVTPTGMERARVAGEPTTKHSLVPYGLRVPDGPPDALDPDTRRGLRARLGLPVDTARPIILSVGSLHPRDHKRMAYTVAEVAALPPPRPFLLLLGYLDDECAPLLTQAREQLGADGFLARSVPASEVADHYRAADVFTLGSLEEGFGRVFLEALTHGLPCVVNDHPVMRYVLAAEGTFTDLTCAGAMTAALTERIADRAADRGPAIRARRRESVRQRFSWSSLVPLYLEMFRRAAAAS